MAMIGARRAVLFRSRDPFDRAGAFINFKRDNTAKWREAIFNAKNGLQSDTIVFMGNSKEFAAWSDGVDQDGLAQQAPSAYLTALLNSQGVCPAENNSFTGCGIMTTNARVKKRDPRITGATSLVPNTAPAAYGPGGYYLQTSTNGAVLGFNTSQIGPAVTFDRITVLGANPSGANNFDIGTSTGGFIMNVANDPGLSSGAARLITANVAGTSNGAAQVTNRNAGSMNIDHVHVWSSTAHKLAIMNLGIPGSTAADWDTDAVAVPSSYTAGLALLNPKVLSIKGLTNDCRLQNNKTTVRSRLASIIDKQLARNGGVVLVHDTPRGTDPGDPTPTPTSLWNEYREILDDLAATSNYDLPIVDLRAALGDWDRLNGLGLQQDIAHLKAVGNALVAEVELAAFRLVAAL